MVSVTNVFCGDPLFFMTQLQPIGFSPSLQQCQPLAPSFFHLFFSFPHNGIDCVWLLLSIIMPFRDHRFARGSTKGLLVTGGVRDMNAGGGKKDKRRKKDSRRQDDESIKTSFYVCIACGFRALDDPGLQFHLEGSRFCLESITGKKQRTALRVLSPQSHNYPSSSNGGHSLVASNKEVGASPDTLFDYTPADDGTILESTNEQDQQDFPSIQEQVADSKHDIDHTLQEFRGIIGR
ncbi:MAG: hypothetical protein MZW92_72430 [Comamonadaceae bacterium]|nr:hypothetical protein [Comamonadaceae bacterium]